MADPTQTKYPAYCSRRQGLKCLAAGGSRRQRFGGLIKIRGIHLRLLLNVGASNSVLQNRMLLGFLAHNVIVWAPHTLARPTMQANRHSRTVRDVLHIS